MKICSVTNVAFKLKYSRKIPNYCQYITKVKEL
jgi:hypothetical protein